MATGTDGGRTYPQPVPQASHRGAPAPNPGNAVSPPSRRELASWWKKFRKTTEKDEEKVNPVPGIFGVPLAESIRYANVAISLTNEQGESFIYGYVPIVVAKCGVFLKEKATDVEGIFRLSGSAKRIKDLQTAFNSPERYGKGLDWSGYTVHDAANILRRYLNQLPEPIVPLEQYERFRDPLRIYQQRLEKYPEGQAPQEVAAAEDTTAVRAYQTLITELPALNRQLLLYILDLLAVFSSKSDLNRMNAANLAAIFQPGIISHPIHDMAPQEYRLSQDVLIFLIENQDNFLIGMTGTGLDEKTQKAVESGAPSLKSPKTNIGRSSSNASAGADSLRKFGLRRNVSVSSHASRERTSPNVSNPGTPSSPSYAPNSAAIGVARSNTVPSKRSPAVTQHRFQRIGDSPSPSSPTVTDSPAEVSVAAVTPERATTTTEQHSTTFPNADASSMPKNAETATVPFPDIAAAAQPAEVQQTPYNAQSANLQVPKNQQPVGSQSRERKISNLFSSKSPVVGPVDPQQNQPNRQPRKLQKRQRLPGAMIESAQSSAASLQGDDPFHTPLMSPDLNHPQTEPNYRNTSVTTHNEPQNSLNLQTPPHSQDSQGQFRGQGHPKSPATSLRSGTSMTDPSDFDALDDPITKEEKKRNRWRFSSSARRTDDSPLAPPPPIGQIPGARTSNSSIGSSGRPRQSFTAESHLAQHYATDSSMTSQPMVMGQSSRESHEPREGITEAEKKGLFGKWKAKMTQSKEERRGREAEKERAKSPPRMTGDNSSSRQSLSAFTHEHFGQRGRSFDRSREDVLQSVTEQPKREVQAGNIGIAQPHPPPIATQTAVLTTAPAASQASTVSPQQSPHGQVHGQAVNLAPQTASLTAPADPTLAQSASTVPADQVTVQNTQVTGNSGPKVMPTVAEVPQLEVDTQAAGEFPAPDSLQHTPTEIKGPSLEDRSNK